MNKTKSNKDKLNKKLEDLSKLSADLNVLKASHMQSSKTMGLLKNLKTKSLNQYRKEIEEHAMLRQLSN